MRVLWSLSNFFLRYFYFYLSKKIAQNIYFYLSTHVQKIVQHWLYEWKHITLLYMMNKDLRVFHVVNLCYL